MKARQMKIEINEAGGLVWNIRGLKIVFTHFDEDFFSKLMKFARCHVKKNRKKVCKIAAAGTENIEYSEIPNGEVQKTGILEMRGHSDGQLIFNLGPDIRMGASFPPREFRENVAECIADFLNENGGWLDFLGLWNGSEEILGKSGDDIVKKYGRLYKKLSRPQKFKPVK